MGDVVSFGHWALEGRYVVMNEPCNRPFHQDNYILVLTNKEVCARCNVVVELINDTEWYG